MDEPHLRRTVFNGLLRATRIATRAELTMQVEDAAIPLHCHSRQVMLRPGLSRNFVPETRKLAYCGLVITDHGGFRIIENGMVVPGAMSRQTILETLQAGCSHRVWFYGAAPLPQLGDPLSDQGEQII